MSKITNFLSEVGSEMRKTSWPKGKELTKYTVVVIVTVIFFGLYFLLIDSGVSELLRWFLEL
jgi:preprotein translocase subunit SecE